MVSIVAFIINPKKDWKNLLVKIKSSSILHLFKLVLLLSSKTNHLF